MQTDNISRLSTQLKEREIERRPTCNMRPDVSGRLQVLVRRETKIMHKARLPRQIDSDDTVQTPASSPCGMGEADPAYFGYWSKEEMLHFLKDLLETERIGTRAFAAIGRAADLHVADLAFKSELAQGAICVLLKKEIATRGGGDALGQSQKKTVTMPDPKSGLQRTITFASFNQARLSDMIEQAVLNIFDSKLNAKLMYLLLLHRKQVEQLETFLT